MSTPIERLHYEKTDLWSPARWADVGSVTDRAMRVLELIQGDAQSVLDVGSGNGLLARVSRGKHPIISLDRSLAALQQAQDRRCQANAFALPFARDSFDVVVSMEMLEHLPVPIYRTALEKIARVSKKNIIITVPFMEKLSKSFVTCPQCSCHFHPYYHVRRYDAGSLQNLFSNYGWVCILFEPVGFDRARRMQLIWRLLLLYLHRRSANFPWYATCPQCGFNQPEAKLDRSADLHSNTLNMFKKWLNSVWPSRPSHLWWLAMYNHK